MRRIGVDGQAQTLKTPTQSNLAPLGGVAYSARSSRGEEVQGDARGVTELGG